MAKPNIDRYPRVVTCRNFFEVEINLLRPEQINKLLVMLHSLDEKDQLKLPCDVQDPNYPTKVSRQIEEQSVFRLVAWHGIDEIVGALALYRGASRWTSHTGRVVMVTHPMYRRYGIATVLMDEMIPLAESVGIKKVYTEVSDMHKEAIRLAKSVGLRKEATLQDHLLDAENKAHKLYIYSLDLDTARENIAARMMEYIRLDYKV